MQSPHLKFRFAQSSEAEAFSRQLKDKFGVTEDQLGEGWRWVIAEGPRIEVYLAPQQLASSLESLLKIRMPYSLGLFTGGVEGGELQVSLELASHLANLIPERKMVILRKEAEQPVLYGRDVLAGSVQHVERHVNIGELVVLANETREILALGQMLCDANELAHASPKQRVIRNLFDKGWYLRRGG